MNNVTLVSGCIVRVSQWQLKNQTKLKCSVRARGDVTYLKHAPVIVALACGTARCRIVVYNASDGGQQ